MLPYLLQGMIYGFSAAVQPGPFQTYLISQALLKGWKSSLLAALAPLVSDGPIIALCLIVLSQVPQSLERFLYIASGLFILYLAYSSYKSWKNFDTKLPEAETRTQQSLWKAALMNMLSPGPYIFWSLVTGPILIRGWREAPLYSVIFMLGFYALMILSLCAIIFLFGSARQLGPKVNRSLLGISAIALFCFGLYQLWLGIIG
ncbi:MAG TPA: LysE family transporter [Anaerolineales bacterium]|nr:LysE family transporter [Anaerolineales bacterium]